jgi:hypothetical protein
MTTALGDRSKTGTLLAEQLGTANEPISNLYALNLGTSDVPVSNIHATDIQASNVSADKIILPTIGSDDKDELKKAIQSEFDRTLPIFLPYVEEPQSFLTVNWSVWMLPGDPTIPIYKFDPYTGTSSATTNGKPSGTNTVAGGNMCFTKEGYIFATRSKQKAIFYNQYRDVVLQEVTLGKQPLCCLLKNGKIFIVTSSTNLGECLYYTYDTETNTLTTNPMPFANEYDHLVTTINGKVLMVSRGDLSPGRYTVDIYDPDTNQVSSIYTWHDGVPDPNFYRMGGTQILPDGNVMIAPGGKDTQLLIYDVDTNSIIETGVTFPVGTASHYQTAGCAVDPLGNIILISGRSYSDVYAYNPTTQTYRTIPWVNIHTTSPLDTEPMIILSDGRILVIDGTIVHIFGTPTLDYSKLLVSSPYFGPAY